MKYMNGGLGDGPTKAIEESHALLEDCVRYCS